MASSRASWSLLALAAWAACVGAHACSSDADCSLNGVCTGGACVCDAPWTYSDCSRLDIHPVRSCFPGNRGCGFHVDDKTTTWGGSILKGDDGLYHMFAAEMANHCSLGTWTTNSLVVMATSKTPDGPYNQTGIAIEPWAHNPEAIRAADGTYVIFTLGNGTRHGPIKNCNGDAADDAEPQPLPRAEMGGETMSPDVTSTVGFTLHYSSSIDGPWTALNATITGFRKDLNWNMHNWNPAPVALADGRVRMMVHTDSTPWGGEVIVEGASWRGPYKVMTGDITNCTKCEEDPFMWVDKRGHWHALFHRMFDPPGKGPIPSPGWAGGHAFSADGVNWSPVVRCYNTTVQLDNGQSIELKRRERPKLVFDKDGVTPLYLSNGVIGPGTSGTYTLVAPLATAAAGREH